MNKSFAFFGREREIDQLRGLHALRKHVLIVGPAGIGKTALLRQVGRYCPLLICEETSSLRRICDGLEQQLMWGHHKLNVIECKNRLLVYLERRGEPVAFDHVACTPPRVARFIAHLSEQIPIWIACRSDRPEQIQNVWEYLYKFTRVEISPLTLAETRALVEQLAAQGTIQADAREHLAEVHRMSGGNPRMLEELLIELAAREYKIDNCFGLELLDLDRRIHEIDLAIKSTATDRTR
jgi:AAA ATPase-like protein